MLECWLVWSFPGRVYASTYTVNHCEFMFSTTTPCPEGRMSQLCPILWLLHSLCLFFWDNTKQFFNFLRASVPQMSVTLLAAIPSLSSALVRHFPKQRLPHSTSKFQEPGFLLSQKLFSQSLESLSLVPDQYIYTCFHSCLICASEFFWPTKSE